MQSLFTPSASLFPPYQHTCTYTYMYTHTRTTIQDASREASPPGLLSSVIDEGMDTKMSMLTSQLLQGTTHHHHTSFSQFLMVVTLVAIFFINPLSFMSPGGVGGPLHAVGGGSMRTLNTLDAPIDVKYTPMDTALYFGFWALRILIAAICFGWMTLKSMPKIVANSSDAVRFWRFRKQAENDLSKVGISGRGCTAILIHLIRWHCVYGLHVTVYLLLALL